LSKNNIEIMTFKPQPNKHYLNLSQVNYISIKMSLWDNTKKRDMNLIIQGILIFNLNIASNLI